MPAPLEGLRIIELAGIGPGPFAGMMLADHGAEVILIERPGEKSGYRNINKRSKRSVIVDLKQPAGVEIVKRLCHNADGFIEGLRPGVTERLGIGPDELLALNPKLVYGRMTGWGQDGPLSRAAGHDLNYIAISGALYSMGRADEKPPVPLNLVGDFGGGGMLLAFGMLSALLVAQRTGQGQVVDAAISDGAALLMSMFYSVEGKVDWQTPRGQHMLTGAAPFYDTYATADGEFITVASNERQFYQLLLEKLGLSNDPDFARRMDPRRWPTAKARFTEIFASKTRDQWCELLEGTDACFAPVLSMSEAVVHPHNKARNTFIEAFGTIQPAPAPRYSVSQLRQPELAEPGSHTDEVLLAVGYTTEEIKALQKAGTLGN